MLIPRFATWIFSVSMVVVGVGMAAGQSYPNKPIRIIAAVAGGSGDIAVRLITPGLVERLGQQVVVDNRAGNMVIPAGIVAKASPDGHTLLVYSNTLWILPLLQRVPLDPERDFSPITLMESSPNVLVVHPSVAANSVQALIALAKARPGALNYGAAGAGASAHLAAELFKAMAGVNIAGINYSGIPQALNDTIAGQVQLIFPPAAAVMPHVKSGRLRALAVTSIQPTALVPGLPTVAESGLPGYESVFILAAFAPAKTPAAIIKRLSQEIVRVLNMAEVKEKLFNAGAEVVGTTPEQLASAMKAETTRIGKVIKDAGIKLD